MGKEFKDLVNIVAQYDLRSLTSFFKVRLLNFGYQHVEQKRVNQSCEDVV